MRGSLKYWLLLGSCIAFALILSYLSYYSRFFAQAFHSVPAVRVCDAAGQVVLYPAHLVFSFFGGLFDQSTPDYSPLNFMFINAVLLGSLLYACLRPLVFRREKTGK